MCKKLLLKLFVVLSVICIASITVLADTTQNEYATNSYSCSHPSNSVIESIPETRFYTAINAEQHGYYERVQRQCILCWHKEMVDKLIRIEPHRFNFEDLGHTGNIHNYQHICYTCLYTKNYSLICNGPQHVSPFFINI